MASPNSTALGLSAPPQRVRVAVPKGKTVKSVQLLVAGRKPIYKEVGGSIEIDVPPFELHEAVAVDLL